MRRDIQPSSPILMYSPDVDLNTNEFSPTGDGFSTGSKATSKRVENDIAWVGRAENNAISVRLPVFASGGFHIHPSNNARAENPDVTRYFLMIVRLWKFLR